MTQRDIIAVVVRDLESKKEFLAEWDGSCFHCGRPILEGDAFIFMGNKEKVCKANCLPEIQEYVESL